MINIVFTLIILVPAGYFLYKWARKEWKKEQHKMKCGGETIAAMIVRMPGIWHELTDEQKEAVKDHWRSPAFNHNEEKIVELVKWFDEYKGE